MSSDLNGETLITDAAVRNYIQRLRRDQVDLGRARADLAAAFSRPLFVLKVDNDHHLIGLQDGSGKRFLAFRASDGSVVEIGPDHFWKEAKSAWIKVGWDSSKGKAYKGSAYVERTGDTVKLELQLHIKVKERLDRVDQNSVRALNKLLDLWEKMHR